LAAGRGPRFLIPILMSIKAQHVVADVAASLSM
jgi:hypothetical protein